MTKVNQEYIDSIKEVQKNLQAIQMELGAISLLELKKKALFDAYVEQEEKVKEVTGKIQDEYGNGSVDLETGEFTEAQPEEAEIVE